jgi:hypothetical protein
MLREEHWLKRFENKVLKKTFELKKNEVTRDWKKLHIKKLRELYFSQNFLRRLRRPGEGALGMCGKGKCIQGFGGYI